MIDAVGITTGAARLKSSAQGDYPNVQNIAIGAAATQTVPFPLLNTVVSLRATVACWFNVGGTAAAHIAGSDYLPANTTWMLKIPQGARLSFIQDSVGGWVSVTPMLNPQSLALLLDGVPSAAAAYSLRKLTNAYAGPCINVRRSSDNATTDIGFVGYGDLDVASFSAFIGGGSGFITKWYDQSGNANHEVQATAASQPQLITPVAALGGRPGILFPAGVHVVLAAPAAASINNIWANGGTLLTVINQTAGPVGTDIPMIVNKGNAATSGWFLDFYNNPGNTLDFTVDGATQGYWDSPSGFALGAHCIDCQYSSASLASVPVLTVDNTKIVTINTQPTGTIVSDAPNTLNIGNQWFGGIGTTSLGGHIAEVILWNSMPNLSAVRTNVRAYWGTP